VSRWLDGCERALTMAAVGATFGMMLLTAADAGGRYLLNRPMLGGAARRAVNHLVQLISALYGTALVLATLQQTYNMMVTRTMLVTMELPQWPGHLVVSIGLFLAAVMMLLDLGQVRKGRSGLFREG
jgi:TRAP-type C4-dicarboxylate transport system permease small subunit